MRRSDSRDDTEITLREEEERRARLDKEVEKALVDGEHDGKDADSGKEHKEDTVDGESKAAEKKKWWGWF